MKPGRVCVLGSLNMDLVVGTPRLPAPGETILGGPFHTHPGGKGANQAVAARRMGAEVTMVGRVGDDPHGQQLQRLLADEGIDTSHLRSLPGEATGVALITVDSAAGENTIIVAGGANQRLTAADVEQARDRITEADVLLLQLEVPIEAVVAAARVARQAGTTVILNAAPAAPLPAELWRSLDVLIVNESEAAHLVGAAVGEAEPEALARELQMQGSASVVLTLGAHGALCCSERKTSTVPALDVTPVDTVGAGDALAGALAAGLAEGLPMQEALPFAAAAGSLATTKAGAIPSLPTRSTVAASWSR